MQIDNDYDKEVYNGDIGRVADVDPDAGELTARFEGRDLVYGFGELDALVPAYAATVHKSQGSEYPAVVIPVLTQPLRDAEAEPALHCQSASKFDPLSACNIDPLSGTAEVVPVVNRGDPCGFV